MTPEEKEKLRALAIELDDPFADDECPNCGGKLHLHHRAHGQGGAHGYQKGSCFIRQDLLYARYLSRQLIRTGEITG